MSKIQRKYLRELSLETTNALVIGIIIGKTEARVFESKSSGDMRGVVCFTIRDSKRHFTNCKFWGSKLKVEEYDRLFRIFDTVNVISPKVIPISRNASEQQFQPNTTTPFLLVVNEGCGAIEKHIGGSGILAEFKALTNLPIKPLANILNLADVNSSGMHRAGQTVDLLVAVKYIKPVRCVKTKAGEERQCLEVIILDKSYPRGMSFTMWQRDWIKRALEQWQPISTLLHLIDARVAYSSFYKSTVLGFSAKTLITENPNGKESAALASFASNLPQMDSEDFGRLDLPKLETITTLMTVQQIYDRTEGDLADDCEQFSAVLFAMVTKFDLDGCSRLIGKRCKFCRRQIPSTQQSCELGQCQMSSSFNDSGEKFDYFFDFNVHLTDHTGTLIEGRLNDQFAEKALGLSAEEFQTKSLSITSSLKWRFLMERFAVKLVVKKKSVTRSRIAVILMELMEVDAEDVAEKVLVY